MESKTKSKEITWRYEVKYLLEPSHWAQLHKMLLIHPEGFKTLYPDRYINNIYFDTPQFEMCRDNLSGIANRKKYRIRWYGDNPISQPNLEEKIKSNSLGYKNTFAYKGATDLQSLQDWINTEHLNAGQLIPSIFNQYLRSYYISHDGLFRLTIDRKIAYKSIPDFKHHRLEPTFKDERIIVELKFDKGSEDRLKDISSYLPIHPSKHSKYVTGVLAIYS